MQDTTNDSSGDCGQSELTRVLCLAQQLRQCLRFDAPTPDETEIEAAARKAADALESMASYAKELEAWKTEGEKLFDKSGANAMFSLGAWWADRPWRNREA